MKVRVMMVKEVVLVNDEEKNVKEFCLDNNPTLLDVLEFVSDCNYIQVMHKTENTLYIICEKRWR